MERSHPADSPRLTARQIWLAPSLLAGMTIIGLVAALLGDGIWDLVSWLGLAAPMVVIVERLVRRRRAWKSQ